MTAIIDDRDAFGPVELEQRLRRLARWYREIAERTANPAIWEARLKTAESLEEEANRMTALSKRG